MKTKLKDWQKAGIETPTDNAVCLRWLSEVILQHDVWCKVGKNTACHMFLLHTHLYPGNSCSSRCVRCLKPRTASLNEGSCNPEQFTVKRLILWGQGAESQLMRFVNPKFREASPSMQCWQQACVKAKHCSVVEYRFTYMYCSAR